jgi:hypothetical protein
VTKGLDVLHKLELLETRKEGIFVMPKEVGRGNGCRVQIASLWRFGAWGCNLGECRVTGMVAAVAASHSRRS